MRRLLVEDDSALGKGICDGVRQEGHTLDLGLPRLGGIEHTGVSLDPATEQVHYTYLVEGKV